MVVSSVGQFSQPASLEIGNMSRMFLTRPPQQSPLSSGHSSPMRESRRAAAGD
jgi:hypothetical protein